MQSNSQVRRDRPETKTSQIPEKAANGEFRGQLEDVTLTNETSANPKDTIGSGVVTDCLRLNIRKEPNLDAEVLTVIDLLSEVVVDMAASTEEFYKVTTSTGVEGFCLKKHIALQR